MRLDDDLSVEELVSLLEMDLGIDPGFLTRLADEDDWSFVIKSHAFLEAALSHLIAHALDAPALGTVLAYLDTANTRSGKLAFLRELDLLDDVSRRFVKSFSELRNSLVHDVSQVSFSFSEYLAGLDKQQTDNFAKSFSLFATGPTFERNGKEVSTREFVLQSSKQSVWFCVMSLCAVIYISKDNVRLRKMLNALQHQVGVPAMGGT